MDVAHDAPDEVCGTLYAAKLLGLSVGSVQTLVERNQLQAWKTKGGHRRISLQSIRDYQRAQGMSGVDSKHTMLRVLVVDDDPVSLEVFRHTIASWNLPIDCTTMPSALEAIIDISSLNPDVLITDLKMPGVDGFELLRTLRGSANFASLILVALTGMSSEEVAERGGLPPNTLIAQKPVDMKWMHGFFTALTSVHQLKQA